MTSRLPIKQPTVRLNLASKQKLDQMQKQTDLSQPALLDRALSLLERELLAKQLESDFTYIANNEEALRRYNETCSVFEGASADGLD